LKTFDFRVERDIKFEEKYQLRILVEAFNLTNTTNVTTVSSTAFTVNNPSGAATAVCKSAVHTNSCIAPFTGTPFLSPTATSNTNIGARQLQLSLRFSF
jgi:hypothetical protein